MAAGEGARPREIASELVASAPAGPARAEALLLLAELETTDRSLSLVQDALAEAAGDPPLQAAIHRLLADEGQVIEGMSWSEQHARAALELGEVHGDDLIRAGALSMLRTPSVQRWETSRRLSWRSRQSTWRSRPTTPKR